MPHTSGTKRGRTRWWDWALIVVGIPAFVLLLWLWLRRRVIRIQVVMPSRPVRVTIPVVAPAPPAPDDLKRIAGIGPKISRLLQTAGITTFAQLAATDVERLKDTLEKADIRIADPGTWPEQADLAAADEWDALKTMQAKLKGGRRV